MAVLRGSYYIWYGLDSEKSNVPNYIKNMDMYYSTDSNKWYIYYEETWYQIN